MNPKINGVSGGATRVESGQRSTEVREKSGASQTTPAGAPDQVSLTDSARLMVRLEKILEDLPAVDRDRVEVIKQAISDGTSSVDAKKVAAEVLRMKMDLNRR